MQEALLRLFNPVPNFSFIFWIYFDIVLTYRLRYSKLSFSFRFSDYNFVCYLYLSHVCSYWLPSSHCPWFAHLILFGGLLRDVIEGKTRRTGRQGRRRKQLLDDLKETRQHWKLEDEGLDRTLWRTHFGRGYGTVVRHYVMMMMMMMMMILSLFGLRKAIRREKMSSDIWRLRWSILLFGDVKCKTCKVSQTPAGNCPACK